ncbi:MAG: glycoside hydrolase family 20 zincin-like fold domain-containing protein, partial [Bacteroidota bacterium]
MKKFLALISVTLLLGACKKDTPPEISIIPLPNQIQKGEGVFILSSSTVLDIRDELSAGEAVFLTEGLQKKTGISLAEGRNAKNV